MKKLKKLIMIEFGLNNIIYCYIKLDIYLLLKNIVSYLN